MSASAQYSSLIKPSISRGNRLTNSSAIGQRQFDSSGTGSQPNSPADSAIGTASESIQSPPLEQSQSQHRQMPSNSSQTHQQQKATSPNDRADSATQPPRPPKRATLKKPELSLPVREKMVCERDYERIIKETETLKGGPGTSMEQLLAESKLSRECLKANAEELRNLGKEPFMDKVQESRRYYYFDSVRHEYRLYYSREVRLRSETNLAALGLDDEADQKPLKWTDQTPPFRRRHSAGAGRLRKAVPPPKIGGQQQQQSAAVGGVGNKIQPMGTTKFPPTAATGIIPLNAQFADEWERPAAAAEEANIPMPLAAAGTSKIEQQQQTPQTLRRGAFERNSTSRKPISTRATSDPPRRRQWSGGAKRAAALKQQELLELQRRGIGQPTAAHIPQLAVPEETRISAQPQPVEKPIPTIRQSKSPATGRTPAAAAAEVLVTNQMLKDMLRPLGKADNNEAMPLAYHQTNEPKIGAGRWGRNAKGGNGNEQERLLGGHSAIDPMLKAGPIRVQMEPHNSTAKPAQQSRSIWDCFGGRRKNQQPAKIEKMQKSGYSLDQQEGPYPARPNGDRLRRIIGCLLIPFFLFVAAAAVAIVVIIWYM